MEQLSPEQQAVAAEVLKQSSAGLGGPYGMLIKSPELLKRYLMMTEYLRQKTSLPHRLNEMAILLEARIWDAQYEWWAHEPLARKAGPVGRHHRRHPRRQAPGRRCSRTRRSSMTW